IGAAGRPGTAWGPRAILLFKDDAAAASACAAWAAWRTVCDFIDGRTSAAARSASVGLRTPPSSFAACCGTSKVCGSQALTEPSSSRGMKRVYELGAPAGGAGLLLPPESDVLIVASAR